MAPEDILQRLQRAWGGPSSYWLTRFVMLRLLGLVYAVAFTILIDQGLPLIGHDGLLPADSFLQGVEAYDGSRREAFLQVPTLFWLTGISDPLLLGLSWLGLALSLVVLCGFANSILMAVLWALYMSFVHVGQLWYGYGWEIQLLETGFLAVFLCPLVDLRPFPRTPPPLPVLWLFRWLGFRIMVGAGLIKLRGDPCWRDLTCLYYHYETQPVPNPLSRYLHFMPHWFHQVGVLWNHFVELGVPWFAFGPRTARRVAGVLLVSFQVVLIASGNLSFLNWLTIVPMLACLDDAFLARLLPRGLVDAAARARDQAAPSRVGLVASVGLLALVAWLSVAPVVNLLSPRQMMNTSFDRFDLVNTYGAFGSVGKVRDEIVLEGTSDEAVTASTSWKEYEFKAKPGDPHRCPPLISPYHYRLDWQMWFAAMSTPEEYPFAFHLVWKLLHNDPGTLHLLDGNPFPDRPPRFIRAELYEYRFAPPGDPDWWHRRRVDSWLPPLSADDPRLREILESYGWLEPGNDAPASK